MLFNSYQFILLFLPVALGGYFFAAHRLGAGAAKVWLVAASLFFYGWWNPRYLILILGSMLGNYWMGQWLGRRLDRPRLQRLGLAFGLAANLSLLGWYKYAGFFVREAGALLGTGWTLHHIILPLGISFFTFLQVGYLVDAARGLTREHRFANYALFVTFFPHLIAGPIVHHSDLMPQFARPESFRFNPRLFAAGFTLFTIGLAKKILIADQLAPDAQKVFAAVGAGLPASASAAWAGLGAFTFQIYFDFSGYSDMAIGLGLLFGIVLPCNFNSPYQSLSIVDFWRRWHMTLSRFFREYLYIPLGGNRRGPARVSLNLLLTMTLAGLWHGANWTFLVWGLAHGCALAANHLWCLKFPAPAAPHRSRWGHSISWAATFLFVVLAWALFRADNLAAAGRFFASLAGIATGPAAAPGLLKPSLYGWLAVLLLICRFAPNSQQWLADVVPSDAAPARWRWTPRLATALACGLLFAVCVLSLSHVSEFIYWQF